jgi:hypothetical protein
VLTITPCALVTKRWLFQQAFDFSETGDLNQSSTSFCNIIVGTPRDPGVGVQIYALSRGWFWLQEDRIGWFTGTARMYFQRLAGLEARASFNDPMSLLKGMSEFFLWNLYLRFVLWLFWLLAKPFVYLPSSPAQTKLLHFTHHIQH